MSKAIPKQWVALLKEATEMFEETYDDANRAMRNALAQEGWLAD